MLFDTHCHIQFNRFADDREEVIARCAEQGMFLNVVGTQKDTSKRAVELAEKYDWMVASIGTHPNHVFPTHIDEEESHFTSREEDFDEAYYEELVRSAKVAAIGETGLDFFHLPKDVPKEAVFEKQKKVFTAQYQFAQKHGKAMVIHCRDAHDELIALLKSFEKPPRAVIHCYTSDRAHAEAYLAMGLYLGFTGVITFPPKKVDPAAQEKLLEVVRNIPLDRIVVETDSPYLAPIPHRGKRAEPWMVKATVAKIAEIKGLSHREVEEATTANATKLFLL